MGEHRDKRDAIMALANELNDQRVKILATVNAINIAVALLVNEAEKHLTAAVEEAEDTKGKAIKTSTLTDMQGLAFEKDDQMTGVHAVAATARLGKRNCGQCGKPGHRRQNCPDADKALKAKKARAPMSEDRKKKLREQLVKARAARKRGGR